MNELVDPELDDRIRRGLHEHAAGVDPHATWPDLRDRMVAGSNHRGSGAAVLVVAAVVVVAVLVGLVVARRDPSPVATVPAPSRPPSSALVALDERGNLVELTVDGAVVRTIAPGPFRGSPAVSPTDRTIYVERLVAGDACASAYVPEDEVVGEILAIPWDGGPSRVAVAHGTEPAVSPDGRHVAYLAGPSDECHVPRTRRLAHTTSLVDGRTTDLGFLSVVVVEPRVGPLAWAPDGSLLVAFSGDHRCMAAGDGERPKRTACTSTYLQSYRFDGGMVVAEPVGTAPVPGAPGPSGPGPSVSLGDLYQLPLVDALAFTGDGTLVTATVDDAETLLVHTVELADGAATATEVTHLDPQGFGGGPFSTTPGAVAVSGDPGSERLALAVRRGDGPTVAWGTAIGTVAELRRIDTPVRGATWVPAG